MTSQQQLSLTAELLLASVKIILMLNYVHMELMLNDIHVWSFDLCISDDQERQKIALLSADEVVRANRYHFPIHRKRYIAARSTLRELLSLYLQTTPTAIKFGYAEYEKPFLAAPEQNILQFNVAHSNDIAVYAFTLHHAIGIDVEYATTESRDGIAQRFFSPAEKLVLAGLPKQEQYKAFYHLWSRKEAVLKASGKGLTTPLSAFTVSCHEVAETIVLEQTQWWLVSLPLFPSYSTALACHQAIPHVKYGIYTESAQILTKEFEFNW